VRPRDSHFIYADYHQQAPEKYIPEMLRALGPESNRFWIVFSHVFRSEDQYILHELSNDWNVEPVLNVEGSALYLALRRPVAVVAVSTGPAKAETASRTTATADHTHDSFWDWNVRNARQSIR
jgi:hypothetical protein